MMLLSLLSVGGLLLGSAPCYALQDRWQNRSLAGATHVPIKIYLSQSHLDEGAQHLLTISNPDSPSYGQHWSAEQAIKFFEPSQESLQAVNDWLDVHDVQNRSYSSSQGSIQFTTTVSNVAILFGCDFVETYEQSTGHSMYGCDAFRIPTHLEKHVDMVSPRLQANIPGQKLKHKGQVSRIEPLPASTTLDDSLTDCSQGITPACIKALYGIPESKKSAISGNSLGIYNTEQLLRGLVYNASWGLIA